MTPLLNELAKSANAFKAFGVWYNLTFSTDITLFLRMKDSRTQTGVLLSFINNKSLHVLYDNTFYIIYQLGQIGYDKLKVVEEAVYNEIDTHMVLEIALIKTFEYINTPF